MKNVIDGGRKSGIITLRNKINSLEQENKELTQQKR